MVIESDKDLLSKLSEGINHVNTDGGGLKGSLKGLAKWGKMAKIANGRKIINESCHFAPLSVPLYATPHSLIPQVSMSGASSHF